MRTWTTYKSGTAGYCNVNTSDTTQMTQIGTFINDSIRTICNLQGGKLRFLESTTEMETVADQTTYQIPNKYRKLIDIYVRDGDQSDSQIYMPRMIFDPKKWKEVLAYNLGSSNIPYFTYVENRTYQFQPTSSVTGNTIILRGRLNTHDLSIDDYTTGTIVSIANEGTAVVGSGTTWTKSMIGRYIQIPITNASNGGDGFWYEIGGWTDATHISLVKPYEGTSISAGSATYTIGQTSVIPEAYDVAVVYRSTALYWQNQGDLVRAKTYWTLYDGGKEAGYTSEYGGLILEMLENEGETEEGAYIPPVGYNNIMQAPYYFPYQLATGFN